MGICRNEIYMCNLKESYKFCISGLHPVIIVSSFKHLLKNDLVQVLPITSNVKKICKSHIDISGFGLDKGSKVQCEQVLTVNREDLTFKIGKVSNVKMYEINNVLKAHLQLDNKFKNLESDDLEEIFFTGVKNMDEQRKLNILKSKIKLAYLEEENYKCIELADELILIKPSNNFLWYGWYSKSLIYMRLNNMELALEYAKKSIKYVSEVDIFSQDYSLSMMALGRCYEGIDNKKSIGIYKTLSHIYRELTDNRLRLSCIFNIAKLSLNPRAMQRLISIVENTKSNSWYFDIDKDKFLENMKLELNAVKGF